MGSERAPGLSLVAVILDARAGRVRSHVRPAATPSLHALAQRYQRGADRDAATVLRDIAVLGDGPGIGQYTATPGGGWWAGEQEQATDRGSGKTIMLHSIRTYLSAEMLRQTAAD
jgi:hypothetical protein